MQVRNIECHFEGVDPFQIFHSYLQDQINRLVENEGKQLGELGIIFCSDQYLLEMNRKYLQHDYFTDIITFNYNENQVVKGDLFISSERVKDNAEKYAVNFRQELYRVIYHGLLHLTGYDDKTDEERLLMREKENYYLSFTDFNLVDHEFEI